MLHKTQHFPLLHCIIWASFPWQNEPRANLNKFAKPEGLRHYIREAGARHIKDWNGSDEDLRETVYKWRLNMALKDGNIVNIPEGFCSSMKERPLISLGMAPWLLSPHPWNHHPSWWMYWTSHLQAQYRGGTEQHHSPPTSKDITDRITDQFLLLGYLILTQKKKQNTKGHGMPPCSSMWGSNNQGCPLSCTKATFAKTSSTLVHTYKHNPPPNSWMG